LAGAAGKRKLELDSASTQVNDQPQENNPKKKPQKKKTPRSVT
jgi:hypothetical protein